MKEKGTQRYPARVERYHEHRVTLYEIEGRDYLSGEDIGRCLGFSEPRKSVNNIFNRNRDELEIHTCVIKMMTQAEDQQRSIRLFTETGANLIGMFAKTAKAREFRLWLARLPKRAREAGPELLARAQAEGFRQAVQVLARLTDEKMSPEDLGLLIRLRRQGLTQAQAGAVLGWSKDQVRHFEKRLRALGLEFPALNQYQRRRALIDGLAAELAQIPPNPPLEKGGDKGRLLSGGSRQGAKAQRRLEALP